MDYNNIGLWLNVIVLIVALLALARDITNFTLPLPIWLPNLLKNPTFWRAVLVVTLSVSLVGSLFRTHNLKESVKQRDLNIDDLNATLTVQETQVAELKVTQATQIAENEQLKNKQTSIDELRKQICGQIKITANPESILFKQEFVGIDYELFAPTESGFKVLLYSVEVFADDGSKLISIDKGNHSTHFDTYVLAGEVKHLTNEGISMTAVYLKSAHNSNAISIIDRKTFHLSLDNGIYCKKDVDVIVRIDQT